MASAPGAQHSQDYNPPDSLVSLSELLRLIQFYNSGGYYPCVGTEDGYCPGPPLNPDLGQPRWRHAADYFPYDSGINLSELLRIIQFYNSGGYHFCPDMGTEDGYCVGPA